MRKQKDKKVVYYQDELKDDFAGTKIKTKTVDKNFKFIHTNPFWRFCSFLLYYCIGVPFMAIYMCLILRVKFVNKKVIKKSQPCFFYGNHTGVIDAFIPNLMLLPRRNRIVVSPDTISIKNLKNISQMFGALPIPTKLSGMKKFVQAIDYYHKRQHITIYPEAHIWPYYTKVRPFTDASFSYPVKYNAPTIAFFTAYTKPKGFSSCFRKANITIYISDPLYPDEGLTGKDAQKNLRDKVYNFMIEKSKFSTYEVIEYRKKEDETQKED